MSSQTHLISLKDPRKNPLIFRFPTVPWSHQTKIRCLCRQPDVLEAGFTCQDLLPFRYEALRAMMFSGRKCRRFRRFIDAGWSWKVGEVSLFSSARLRMFYVGFVMSFLRVDSFWTLCLKLISYLKPDVGLSGGKASFVYLIFFQNLLTAFHQIIHPGKLTAGI